MSKIIAVLALAFAALANPVFAAESLLWNKWNVSPYANSFTEACQRSPQAIDGFNMPPTVKDHFKSVVGSLCGGGKEVWLTPGMQLEQMWSGKSGKKLPHLMNKKSVGELPVTTSPDGRPYRKGAVAETARAYLWEFVYEGKTYVLYLPFVCFNWSWAYGTPPQSLQCATVKYIVEPGDEVRFAVLSERRLPASACWELCDGEDCAAPPSPCDTCDWIGPRSVIPNGQEPHHTGKYVTRARVQTLRLPEEAALNYVALCVNREGSGESNSWIIQPSAWRGSKIVTVPYDGQEWPSWGEVDMSKWSKEAITAD